MNPSHGLVCEHVKSETAYAFYRHFLGHGTEYNLLCPACGKNIGSSSPPLQKVSLERFNYFDLDCEEIMGQPEILSRESDLKFVHQSIDFAFESYLDIQPFSDQWMVIAADGWLIRIHLDTLEQEEIFQVSETDLMLSDDVGMIVSPDERFVAVVNRHGQYGIVIDLEQGKVVLNLDRGMYHIEHTIFPLAFVEQVNKTLVIHGTDWNRLDITDLLTGKLLTERSPTEYQREEERPEHYLDYFHGELTVSPDGKWIIDDGWVWTPIGVPRVWDLSKWLHENVWESEDGDSVKKLTRRGYFWESPMCWISSEQVIVWGYGTEDYAMTDGVQTFDVTTGERIGWFAGPQKDGLFFDKYLFSTSQVGTDVWDVQTGERLLHVPELTLLRYHVKTQQFLSKMADGVYELSTPVGLAE